MEAQKRLRLSTSASAGAGAAATSDGAGAAVLMAEAVDWVLDRTPEAESVAPQAEAFSAATHQEEAWRGLYATVDGTEAWHGAPRSSISGISFTP